MMSALLSIGIDQFPRKVGIEEGGVPQNPTVRAVLLQMDSLTSGQFQQQGAGSECSELIPNEGIYMRIHNGIINMHVN